jgi:hypothetical protein
MDLTPSEALKFIAAHQRAVADRLCNPPLVIDDTGKPLGLLRPDGSYGWPLYMTEGDDDAPSLDPSPSSEAPSQD